MSKLITYHPTFAFFYAPQEAGTFLKDLEHFSWLVKGVKPKPMTLVPNPTLAQVKLACRKEYVSVDIETAPAARDCGWTGKDPTRARLKTLGLGHDGYAVSIWWATASAAVRSYVTDLLRDGSRLKVFQNGPWFDIPVLARYRMPVKNYVDTRDMRRAQSATSRVSLLYMASIYDYTNNWKHAEEGDDEKGIVYSDDKIKLQKYNAQDCIETSRVYLGLKAEPWGAREKRLHDVHAKTSIIAADMYATGIRINVCERRFMLHCLEQSIEEKREALVRLVNVDGFEATDMHMRAIIYKKHEWVKRIGGKKKGQDFRIAKFSLPDPLNKKMYTDDTLSTISVDEASLLLLLASGDCPPALIPILDAWWDLQSEKKRRGYVGSKLIDQATGLDGRLRPGWNNAGAATMRWTCSEPNVQNVEQTLRCMFGPPPGHVLVHADKSQLELRVMEVVANDRGMAKALATGDVYSFDVQNWFGMHDIDVATIKKQYGARRKAAKIIHLGSQYGAGVAVIYNQALKEDRNFKFNAARILNNQFKTTYSDTVKYWFDEMKFVEETGYSEGRILQGRRVYGAMPDLSDCANFPIQRTASEMMNLEMIDLYDRLRSEVPTAKIVIQLHDAFDVECHARDEAKVCKIMTEVMDREWTIDGRTRRFPIEMKVTRASEGGTWADV